MNRNLIPFALVVGIITIILTAGCSSPAQPDSTFQPIAADSDGGLVGVRTTCGVPAFTSVGTSGNNVSATWTSTGSNGYVVGLEYQRIASDDLPWEGRGTMTVRDERLPDPTYLDWGRWRLSVRANDCGIWSESVTISMNGTAPTVPESSDPEVPVPAPSLPDGPPPTHGCHSRKGDNLPACHH